jgi:hypothetical protein
MLQTMTSPPIAARSAKGKRVAYSDDPIHLVVNPEGLFQKMP